MKAYSVVLLLVYRLFCWLASYSRDVSYPTTVRARVRILGASNFLVNIGYRGRFADQVDRDGATTACHDHGVRMIVDSQEHNGRCRYLQPKPRSTIV